MPQRLNYSAHVCDELRTLAAQFRRNGTRPGDREAIKEWIEEIDASVKYQLPENGQYISHSKPLPVGMMLQRLPFRSVSLEVPYPMSADPIVREDGLTASTRRHILCREARQAHAGTDADGNDMYLYEYDAAEPDGIHIQTVCWLDKSRCWIPLACGAFLPYSEPVVFEDAFSGDGRRYAFTSAFGSLPDFADEEKARLGMKEFIRNMSIDITAEVKITVEFLQVLACRNIREIESTPPRVLNNQRRRKGKTPFDVVRMLTVGDVLIGRASRPATNDNQFKVREHMRTGHIRRLPDQQVWVSDCIVAAGSPMGRVSKSYVLN